jgi:hypothetical protein
MPALWDDMQVTVLRQVGLLGAGPHSRKDVICPGDHMHLARKCRKDMVSTWAGVKSSNAPHHVVKRLPHEDAFGFVDNRR